MILLSIILITIASVSESVMDTLAHHYETSFFVKFNPYFWNPVLSGSNKWKNGSKKQGEKFFLSSTLLVGFTEGWHLFKMIRTFCLFAAIGVLEYEFNKTIYLSVILRVVFGLIFTVFYKKFQN